MRSNSFEIGELRNIFLRKTGAKYLYFPGLWTSGTEKKKHGGQLKIFLLGRKNEPEEIYKKKNTLSQRAVSRCKPSKWSEQEETRK